jgi:acetyltransferase
MTDIDTIAREVCKVSEQSDKRSMLPSWVSWTVPRASKFFRPEHPHYILRSTWAGHSPARTASSAARSSADQVKNFGNVDPKKAKALLDAALAAGEHHLPAEKANQVLEAYGLPILPRAVAASAQDAAKLGEKIGFPVVMKVESKDVVHKIDVGGWYSYRFGVKRLGRLMSDREKNSSTRISPRQRSTASWCRRWSRVARKSSSASRTILLSAR